ncbi:MAG TPA: hypothetical protein VHD87_00555 [Acidimicrobiales bacterium]|nr:hypothetical protein [Acidimicrobiales bacterium]
MTTMTPEVAAPAAVPHAVAHTSHRIVARAVAAVGLLGIGLIHLLDLPGKIKETPYLGVAYILLIIGTLVASAWLAVRDDRRAWVLGGALAALTLVGYVVNRTVGMPGAMDDVGNWLEPLGLASLFVEALVVILSGFVLANRA